MSNTKLIKEFKFKTKKEKDKWAWLQAPTHKVFYGKHWVGTIADEKPHYIKLMVIKTELLTDNNPNCNWLWITLSKKSDNLKDAQEFLNQVFFKLLDKYSFYLNDL